MTEQEYKQKEEKIKQRNKNIQMKQKLHRMKKSRFPKFKKPSTSKIVLFIVFVICIQILWFSEHMAITTGGTSYMYSLIGVPVTLIPTIISYYAKASRENRVGGITYDMAMTQQNTDNYSFTSDDTDSDGAVG
nr:hypothetical protein [uncultured Lachnoclostridium sp.]